MPRVGQIGDDAIPHAGGRIKQRGHAESFEDVQQNRGSRE